MIVLALDHVMVRVMVTGFLTAGAAGLMLPLSRLLDRELHRVAGQFGLALLVV